MPHQLQEARAALPLAAHEVFQSEPDAHSIGIGRVDGQLGFIVEHHIDHGDQHGHHHPPRAQLLLGRLPQQVEGWPLRWRPAVQRAQPLARLPRAMRPLSGSMHPEQRPARPLVCGLEIQNLDADQRAGALPHGCFVGTLGCLVRTAKGEVAMLSNAHVLADSGRGHVGRDRILQAGCRTFNQEHHVAHLGASMPLVACPPFTRWGDVRAVANVADAAIAPLLPGVAHAQAFLSDRVVARPNGAGTAELGEPVFKVGRTSGLTRGVVDRVNVLYSVPYDHGDCWFEDLFSVVTPDGSHFAEGGDSGSAVLRTDGTVLGLVFAGAPMGTLCCDMGAVLAGLTCELL